MHIHDSWCATLLRNFPVYGIFLLQKIKTLTSFCHIVILLRQGTFTALLVTRYVRSTLWRYFNDELNKKLTIQLPFSLLINKSFYCILQKMFICPYLHSKTKVQAFLCWLIETSTRDSFYTYKRYGLKKNYIQYWIETLFFM